MCLASLSFTWRRDTSIGLEGLGWLEVASSGRGAEDGGVDEVGGTESERTSGDDVNVRLADKGADIQGAIAPARQALATSIVGS